MFAALLLALTGPVAQAPPAVPLWGRWEASFTAFDEASPDAELALTLTAPSGRERRVAGFWDGSTTWRVRFMPDEEGKWSYRTVARADTGLNGKTGEFVCRRAEGRVGLWQARGPVRVASNGRHLQHADGTPFFWLGDTVWTGPAFSTKADWETYLDDRARKRFSVVQFNTLSPWRTAPTDAEGRVAYTQGRRVRPNPDYFRRLDERIDAINAHGLLAAPVLIWAHTRTDAGNVLPEEDVIRLLRYQVARYGANHVLWALAGDNSYQKEQGARWRRIGYAVFGDKAHPAPVTTHPTGMNWPWDEWRDETWLTVLGYQSGHGDDAGTLRWAHSGPPATSWSKAPPRPIINLEPPYEDHLGYQSRKPHSAYSVRRVVYWGLLSTPPAGVTYGAHGLWSWQATGGQTPPDHPTTGVARSWREAMALPGSTDMKHMAGLFQALPWWRLRPAQNILDRQPGGTDPARHVAIAASEEGDLAVAYLPVGGEVTLKADRLAEGLIGDWFDPRTGGSRPAKDEQGRFRAPDTQDWVLVLRKP